MSRATISSDAMLSSNHVRDTSEVTSLDNEWKTATAKGKSKRGTQPAEVSAKAKGNAAPAPAVSSKSAPKSAPKPAIAPAPQLTTKTETAADPAKRLKNLRKKLREIETIEQKAASGVKLEKEQLDKIARKSEILQEMEDIE